MQPLRFVRPMILGSILASVAVFLAPFPAAAQAVPDLSGTWQGTYECRQGTTGLTLTFAPDGKGGYSGAFAFFAVKDNPDVARGSFAVTALHDRASGSFSVDPQLWIDQPLGYVTVPLEGELSEDGQAFAGEVLTEGCGRFLVKRYLS